MQIPFGSTTQIIVGVPCTTDDTAAVLGRDATFGDDDFRLDGLGIPGTQLDVDFTGNLRWIPTGAETIGPHQITCRLTGYCMAPFFVEVMSQGDTIVWPGALSVTVDGGAPSVIQLSGRAYGYPVWGADALIIIKIGDGSAHWGVILNDNTYVSDNGLFNSQTWTVAEGGVHTLVVKPIYNALDPNGELPGDTLLRKSVDGSWADDSPLDVMQKLYTLEGGFPTMTQAACAAAITAAVNDGELHQPNNVTLKIQGVVIDG